MIFCKRVKFSLDQWSPSVSTSALQKMTLSDKKYPDGKEENYQDVQKITQQKKKKITQSDKLRLGDEALSIGVLR